MVRLLNTKNLKIPAEAGYFYLHEFFRNDIIKLIEKTLKAILGEKLELVDIVAESKNDLHKAALNAIYFDIKTRTTDGRIVTLDLQRKYIKERVRKRTVYYACREISSQEVKHGEYENLKNVVVTFLLTEASLKNTRDNRCVLLKDSDTGDVYSDILTIHEVNIQHIGKQNKEELRILKSFFEIGTEEDYRKFEKEYGNNDYGKLLIDSYIEATRNDTLLDSLSKEDKYMIRLTDEERLVEREKGKIEGREEGRVEGRVEGREEGLTEGLAKGLTEGLAKGQKNKAIEIAVNLINMNMSLASISQATGLSEEELASL